MQDRIDELRETLLLTCTIASVLPKAGDTGRTVASQLAWLDVTVDQAARIASDVSDLVSKGPYEDASNPKALAYMVNGVEVTFRATPKDPSYDFALHLEGEEAIGIVVDDVTGGIIFECFDQREFELHADFDFAA